jgi:hypothetical protein
MQIRNKFKDYFFPGYLPGWKMLIQLEELPEPCSTKAIKYYFETYYIPQCIKWLKELKCK